MENNLFAGDKHRILFLIYEVHPLIEIICVTTQTQNCDISGGAQKITFKRTVKQLRVFG
jgi:hypothetical protein